VGGGLFDRPSIAQSTHDGNIENLTRNDLRTAKRKRDVECFTDGETEELRRRYTDDVVHEFIESLRSEPWFANTIFEQVGFYPSRGPDAPLALGQSYHTSAYIIFTIAWRTISTSR